MLLCYRVFNKLLNIYIDICFIINVVYCIVVVYLRILESFKCVVNFCIFIKIVSLGEVCFVVSIVYRMVIRVCVCLILRGI